MADFQRNSPASAQKLRRRPPSAAQNLQATAHPERGLSPPFASPIFLPSFSCLYLFAVPSAGPLRLCAISHPPSSVSPFFCLHLSAVPSAGPPRFSPSAIPPFSFPIFLPPSFCRSVRWTAPHPCISHPPFSFPIFLPPFFCLLPPSVFLL